MASKIDEKYIVCVDDNFEVINFPISNDVDYNTFLVSVSHYKDNNKNEIHEFDIVCSMNDEKNIGIVCYDSKQKKWTIEFENKTLKGSNAVFKKLKVIGSIFLHKNLLDVNPKLKLLRENILKKNVGISLSKTEENIQRNKTLIKEFPFLLPRNVFTDQVVEGYTYEYTLLDFLPEAWKRAFGLNLCKDLKSALIEDNLLEKFRIDEIKEKYGKLRIYTNFTTDKLDEVITKYEDLSMMTCIFCGKPATHYTLGWTNYVCKDCANCKSQKLTVKDIPSRSLYTKDGIVNIESIYKKEMIKLWK